MLLLFLPEWGQELLGTGLYRRVRLCIGLSVGCGVYAVFCVSKGGGRSWGDQPSLRNVCLKPDTTDAQNSHEPVPISAARDIARGSVCGRCCIKSGNVIFSLCSSNFGTVSYTLLLLFPFSAL